MTTNETTHTEQGQRVAILRDREDNLFALPLSLIETHRVPDTHRTEVEAILRRQDDDLSGFLGPLMGAAAGVVIYVGVIYGGAYAGAAAGWLAGGGSWSTIPWYEAKPNLLN